jgi:hypothetical protein
MTAEPNTTKLETMWRPIRTEILDEVVCAIFDEERESHERVLIAARDRVEATNIEVFLCTESKGLFYPIHSMLALDEDGWIPYAWNPDVPPQPETEKQ